MIYFLEHDADGNIYHTAFYPLATIVPLINIVTVKNGDGSLKSMAEPVGIDADSYNALISEGLDKYLFDPMTGKIVKKAATNG
jgi:hypothetical protein